MTGFKYSGKGWASGDLDMAVHHQIWVQMIRRWSSGKLMRRKWTEV